MLTEEQLIQYHKNANFNRFYDNRLKELNEASKYVNSQPLRKFMVLRNRADIPHTERNKSAIFYDQYINEYYNFYFSGIVGYNRHIDILLEGLTISADINKTLSIFNKIFPDNSVYGMYIKSNIKHLVIYLDIAEDLYNFFKDEINNALNVTGYYISTRTVRHDPDFGKILEFTLEPKYLYECTDYIYDKTDQILYHITCRKNAEKIAKLGLIPKSLNKKSEHPERIYMFYKKDNIIYNEYVFKKQAISLYKLSGKYNQNITGFLNANKKLDIVVLKIDLTKYPAIRYRFFHDPNHSDGVFIYDTVAPACISVEYEFEI